MGIIENGILGTVKNKVGGVVGSNWKGRNTLRAYSKPANPRTAKQILQRDKMGRANIFSKRLVGPIFNVFWDPFLKSISGFNAFMSVNLSKFTETIAYATLVIVEGKLQQLFISSLATDISNNQLTVNWDPSSISDSEWMEKASIVVYNVTDDRFEIFTDVASLGNTQAILDLFSLNLADDIAVYLFWSKTVDGVLTGVSTSTAVVEVVPA